MEFNRKKKNNFKYGKIFHKYLLNQNNFNFINILFNITGGITENETVGDLGQHDEVAAVVQGNNNNGASQE